MSKVFDLTSGPGGGSGGGAVESPIGVGDLLNTVRRDLDERWLLCNGEAVPDGYDALDVVLYDSVATNLRSNAVDDLAGTTFIIKDGVSAGDYIVAVGGVSDSTSSASPVVLVSKAPNGAWRAFPLEGRGVLHSVKYENGVLVAVGEAQVSSGSTEIGIICTATDPLGEWTRWECETARFQDVAFYDGVWGAVGWYSNKLPSVFTAEDPTGPWTGYSLGETSSVEMYGIACHEGTWAVCGKSGMLLYADAIDGTWTQVTLSGDHNKIAFMDGMWVLSSDRGLYVADAMTGAWTMVFGASGTTARNIFNCENIDGRFYAYTRSYDVQAIDPTYTPGLFYADSLTGTWTNIRLSDKGATSTTLRKILRHRDIIALIGNRVNTSNYSLTGSRVYTTTDIVLGAWQRKYETGRTVALVDGAMARKDGAYVLAGYSSTTLSAPDILVAEGPDGPWWVSYPANSLGASENYIAIRGLAQHNGAWVAVGNTAALTGTSARPAICYTDDPMGEWKFKQISDTAYILTDVTCHEGTWVAVGYTATGSYPCALVSDDPGGDWTAYQLSTTACTLEAVHSRDGVWVAVGGSGVGKCYSYTAEDPTKAWTQTAIATPYYLHDVTCGDGTWVAVGSIGASSQSALYMSEDPAIGWEQVTLSFFTTSSPALYGVGYYAGKWFVVGDTGSAVFVYSTTNLTGEWLQGVVDTPDRKVFDLTADDYKVYALGTAHVLESYQALPMVSLAGAYTYIRGKE